MAMITGAYRSQCHPHTLLLHLFLTVASAFSVLESQLSCLNLSKISILIASTRTLVAQIAQKENNIPFCFLIRSLVLLVLLLFLEAQFAEAFPDITGPPSTASDFAEARRNPRIYGGIYGGFICEVGWWNMMKHIWRFYMEVS